MQSATARIGVAVGDLFPRSRLTGSFGYLAPTFNDLGESRDRFYSVGPAFPWAAFDLGRVRARITSARTKRTPRSRTIRARC